MSQLSLPIPYPPGYCEQIRWEPERWPQYVKDAQGRQWLVLHVGGGVGKGQHSRFCCHKPRTVEYHHIRDTEAYPE